MALPAGPEYFRALAGYNAWANARLYDACAKLNDAEYRKDRGAFFRSIHGTLNHLLVGDRIWYGRLTATDQGIRSLDQILHDDLASLRRAREEEDTRLQAYCEALGADRAASILHYTSMATGQKAALPISTILAHLFNHQTHHRGQVHAMLTQTGVPAPPLDLLYYALS